MTTDNASENLGDSEASVTDGARQAPKAASRPDLLLNEIDQGLNSGASCGHGRLVKLQKKAESALQSGDLDEDQKNLLADRVHKLSGSVDKLNSEIKRLHEACDEILKQLEASIEASQTKLSLSLYEKCQARTHKLSSLGDDPKRVAKIAKRLRRFKPALNTLKAWRSWGMGRAREDLIANVEGLCHAELPPQELRIQIRDARNQWNKWNQSGDYPSKALRQRFDQACSKAYEPCKSFLIEQKAKREGNLEVRNRICEELEDIFNSTNWNRPDWVAVGTAIRNARKQWKTAVPLSKRDWQTTNERFDQVMRQYEPYLDRERARCYEQRCKLIDKVEELDSKPLREAIDGVKRIQQDWKNVTVRSSKQRENQLWDRFRSACDKQFARRTAMHEASKQQRQESIQAKKQLLQQIKTINHAPADQIGDLQAEARKLKNQWAAIPRTQKNESKSVDSALRDEFDIFAKRIAARKSREFDLLIESLESRAHLCVELENAVDTESALEVLDSVHQRWQEIGSDSGIYQEPIERRYAAVRKAIENKEAALPSTQGNLDKKLSICLQLEILSEIDSPPEYARDRMAYQVSRLNARLTTDETGPKDPGQQCRELAAKFLTTGAVPPEQSESLQKRFAYIRDRMKSVAAD